MYKILARMASFLLVSLVIIAPQLCHANVQDSIVKIFTMAKKYDYVTPWQVSGYEQWTGSGCIVSGNRILTNAHVVSNSAYIEVQRNGVQGKLKAEVLAISHEADLALLSVAEPAFFEGVEPVEIGGLPELLDDVTVYGYPEGGDGLSVTRGVVSRIEVTNYTHSWLSFLALQIDAAINSGNSGGPVIRDGKIIGVAMQSMLDAENIGYIIPTPIIEHFLTDLQDGVYNGFPSDGVIIQSLENTSLRKSTGLPINETGIYINQIIPGASADKLLHVGDVIMEIDGHPIANDGSVLLRTGLRVDSDHYVVTHQVGEKARFTIWREGDKQEIEVPLTSRGIENNLIIYPEYDVAPEYYILGGLVLMPLSLNYLFTWGDEWLSSAPISLLNVILQDKKVANEQAVIIGGVLTSKVNAGYEDILHSRVVKINGQSFAGLLELASRLESLLAKRDLITLEMENHSIIVVSPKEHLESEAGLLEIYGISKPKNVVGAALL